jgi:ornithine decarboxylase
VKAAKNVFDQGAKVGYKFTLLDIGGGFPGHTQAEISFEDTAVHLKRGFSEFFPQESGVKIIAEPGRFFVASAYTTVLNITSVREVAGSGENKDVEGYMYYLNDGVYGSFNCILFDHQYPVPYSLKGTGDEQMFECSVWGPTCDSLDCIAKSAKLPKLSIGDWIVFDNMGAYTTAAASQFNGFNKPNIHYMCHKSIETIAATKPHVENNNNTNNNAKSCKSAAKIPRATPIAVPSVC